MRPIDPDPDFGAPGSTEPYDPSTPVPATPYDPPARSKNWIVYAFAAVVTLAIIFIFV